MDFFYQKKLLSWQEKSMEFQNHYGSGSTETTDLFPESPIVSASFGERLGAAFIDGFIVLIPNFIVQMALGDGLGNVVAIIISWLYFALQESSPSQATLGKKALGIKVISTDGSQLSFGQASGRYFGKILSSLILFIGYLMMLWDDKQQTLHDKMANALVVKK